MLKRVSKIVKKTNIFKKYFFNFGALKPKFNWKFVLRWNLIFFIFLALLMQVNAQENVCYIDEDFEIYTDINSLVDGSVGLNWDLIDGNFLAHGSFSEAEGSQRLFVKNSIGGTNSIHLNLLPDNSTLNCTSSPVTIEVDLRIDALAGSSVVDILRLETDRLANKVIIGLGFDPFIAVSSLFGLLDTQDAIFDSGFVNISRNRNTRIKIELENFDGINCTTRYYRDNVLKESIETIADGTHDATKYGLFEIHTGNNLLTGANWSIDNLQVYSGIGTNWCGGICGAPHVIFCDNFNYENTLVSEKNWNMITNGRFNDTLTPIDDEFIFIDNDIDLRMSQLLPETVVNYTIAEKISVITSTSYPIVSHTFDFNVTSNNTFFIYKVFDNAFEESINVQFFGGQVFFFNKTISDYTLIGNASANETHSATIRQFIGKDTQKIVSLDYNVTQPFSVYEVFVDGVSLGSNLPYTSNASSATANMFILKSPTINSGVILDNMFIFRGTSRTINTEAPFIIPLFIDPGETTLETLVVPETETSTSDNAIINAFRDIPTGGLGFDIIWYIIMFVVGLTVFMGAAKVTDGVTALGGMIIVEIFLLIMGTLLGFVPVGIVIAIIVVGLVISGLFIRKMFAGTAN